MGGLEMVCGSWKVWEMCWGGEFTGENWMELKE